LSKAGLLVALTALALLTGLAFAADEPDVVAQVLNYSSFGNESGEAYCHWKNVGECRYEIALNAAAKNNKNLCQQIKGQLPSTLDLNSFDPRNFKYTSLIGGDFTAVSYMNEVLTLGKAYPDRVQRGWELIFTKYCKGTEKPF
jgi:hypothetical protein